MLLIVALVIVYLLSISKLPLDNYYLKSLISFLNIGMAGFVLSAISLRFIFPAVSLEGKCWWLVRSMPISVGRFLWSKFLLSFMPLVILGVSLVWISNQLLNVESFVVWLSNITIFFVAISLSSLGVGMGAVFPRFNIENIAQIETSPGGIFYMICSMFYLGLTLSLEAVLMRMHFFTRMRGGSSRGVHTVVFIIIFLIILNLTIIILPMKIGEKSLRKNEN